ncbi:MAG: hypothetical protein JWM68_5054 [Verrucomicrobiales bacterium]|nr:hypothetical protein [Verrucomicrobiales bacterium]
MNRNDFSTPRGGKPSRAMGFTLVELLVVIAIMGIVASMVLGLAGMAGASERRKRVVAQRDQLITAIEAYKKEHGFYPPDNTNNAALPPLFYELRGGTINAGTYSGVFSNITSADYLRVFGHSGIANSKPTLDPNDRESEKPKDHIAGVRPQQSTNILVTLSPGPDLWVMFFTVGIESVQGGDFKTNTWRYVSSNPVHNVGHFDLWADIIIKGKPEVIGNWNQ